jgi:hypothetical protein
MNARLHFSLNPKDIFNNPWGCMRTGYRLLLGKRAYQEVALGHRVGAEVERSLVKHEAKGDTRAKHLGAVFVLCRVPEREIGPEPSLF